MLQTLLTSCAPADTMTSQELLLFIAASILFPLATFYIGRIWELKRRKYQLEIDIQELETYAIERFEETARHTYFVATMTALHDTSRGACALPRSKEAFAAVWKETEFRYRHWICESAKDIWKNPMSFFNPDSN